MNELNVVNLGLGDKKIRMLVVIASFGLKNLELLKQIIRRYQSMALDIDLVVISNEPKELDSGVKVVVGLPSKNPWSLPFAHKPIFAQNVDQYDLFAYSEDDIGVTEYNIHAFLRVTPYLKQNEIAGFLRYELNDSGFLSLPEAHGRYHWKPESVQQRGDYTIAEFTNEHAAFYLITKAQLKKAIASGGFLRSPYEGKYDMLCTAATDPYTSCGFRKVICLSAFDDFLIHHLSNRYAGEYGIPISAFREQIQTLFAINKGLHPASNLCHAETGMLHGEWSKLYYEHPCKVLLTLVPENAKNILSIGCGWGATEAKLKERGALITALPMDSVIGAVASNLGIDVIYGSLNDALKKLEGRTFDCVIMTNLLHLLPDPEQVVEISSHFIRQGGTFVISGPNFGAVKVMVKRILRMGGYQKLGDFNKSGINLLSPSKLIGYLNNLDFNNVDIRWLDNSANRRIERKFGYLTAESWILQARR